jgi:hypothetical protein
MSHGFAEVVILAEDERSANFLRRYVMRALNNKGYRRIRQQVSPSARGDAKQWILARYPLEVAALRSKHPKTGLVLHLDADTETVAKRTMQLADTLKNAGQDAREPDERISHAISRRHTETWLCTLTGVVVDEEDDCKRQRRLSDFDAVVRQAALALYDLTRANAPPPALSSLAAAVPELRRLES